MTVADPAGNLLSDARQLAVGVDGCHASLLVCDLVENVGAQLSWPKHSDRNDLNSRRAELGGNARRILCPNVRRPVSYDDRDPRHIRSSAGASHEDLVAQGVECGSQIAAANGTEIAYVSDALLGRLAVGVSVEAELDVSPVAVTDKSDAYHALRDGEPVDDEINEGNHLTPGGLALRLGRRVDNERNVQHRTASCCCCTSKTISDNDDIDDDEYMITSIKLVEKRSCACLYKWGKRI